MHGVPVYGGMEPLPLVRPLQSVFGSVFTPGLGPPLHSEFALLEPEIAKHHRRRQAPRKCPLDWYYAAAAANPFTAAAAVRLAAASPPMKRARVVVPPPASPIGAARTVIAKSPSTPPARKPQGTVCLDDLKTYCTGPDILICGNCREMFRSLPDLLHHKREYCKLRFACKCSHETQQLPRTDDVGSMLLCGLCTESFMTAWLLIEHFQATHAVEIYKLDSGEDESDKGPSCDGNCSGEPVGVAPTDSDGPASTGSREADNDEESAERAAGRDPS